MDFCVNSLKFSFPDSFILLSSSPNLLINLPDWNKQNPQREYPLYLWPRNKVWMRAHKASIQNAATKVTDIGDILSGGSSVYSSRQIPIYLFVSKKILDFSTSYDIFVITCFDIQTILIQNNIISKQ